MRCENAVPTEHFPICQSLKYFSRENFVLLLFFFNGCVQRSSSYAVLLVRKAVRKIMSDNEVYFKTTDSRRVGTTLCIFPI